MHRRGDGDTIVAIATAAGVAGLAVIRLSGTAAAAIAETLAGIQPRPRHAHYARFRDADGEAIDDGLLLLFRAPRSYTGEDVVELQVHGSMPLLQRLLTRCVELGARRARAGEFTERAFLNGRLDLAQAEALDDLIAARDEASARAARRSLEGAFSASTNTLAERMLALRVELEAAIDFPDEDIDTAAQDLLLARLDQVREDVRCLLAQARRGQRLRDGLHAVIVGAPNAGKSTLLNALAGSERAIVTDQPGTTRDLLRETLCIDGLELTLVDTAGLRECSDPVEREGVRRALAELERADLVLAVVDAADPEAVAALAARLGGLRATRLWLHNKIDRLGHAAGAASDAQGEHLYLSARTGAGLDALRAAMLEHGRGALDAGAFTARARHVEALHRSAMSLDQAALELQRGAWELAAEAMRQAHDAVGEITGRVSPDALLGLVFSKFCIGK